MRHAIASFKEAFGEFKKKPKEFILPSILSFIIASVLFLLAFFILLASGIIGVGAFNKLFSLPTASLDAAALVLVALAMFAILLFFSWVLCGTIGAYFGELNSIYAEKKHSPWDFLLSIPSHANATFMAVLLSAAVVAFPVIAFSALASFFSESWLFATVLFLAGAAISWLLSLLFVLVFPSCCTGGKRGASAAFHSARLALKNPADIFAWAVALCLLSLPLFIPLLGVLYFVLFAMPFSTLSLLILFKKLR
ncbi:MAG: hypothetical protein N3G22_01010 [Candidatus Micrarchaeota archaeon]|nr:hypothetical protein [Candidatus Micrarchaeota archaeon]